MPALKALTDPEIAARLADQPRWRFVNGALRRLYRTHGWKGSMMVANSVAHLAEAAWHHPDLSVSWDKVEVALSTHDVGGISERDFELARKIEDVVCWRPGRDGGALEGTPADPRFAYVAYDD